MANDGYPISVEIVEGVKGVRIKKDKYDTTFSTTRNGYQWTGFPVDEELLRMMRTAIGRWLKNQE